MNDSEQRGGSPSSLWQRFEIPKSLEFDFAFSMGVMIFKLKG